MLGVLVWYSLSSWTDNHLSSNYQIHMLNTTSSPFGNCFVWLLAIPTYYLLRGKSEWSLGLQGTDRSAWVPSVHLLEQPLHCVVWYLVLVIFSRPCSMSLAMARTWEHISSYCWHSTMPWVPPSGCHSLCQNRRKKYQDHHNLLVFPYLSWSKGWQEGAGK